MTALKLFRYSNPEHEAASSVLCGRHPPSTINTPDWLVWLTLAVMLAFTTSPALPQAGVAAGDRQNRLLFLGS
jgi:hypothetical protein